jgi:DNA-binding NarL/FixJ family response regulator
MNYPLMNISRVETTRPRSVLVAARSDIVVRGLMSILSEKPSLRALESANDANTALLAIRTHRPDIALIDIELATPLRSLLNDHDFPFRAILVSTRPFPPGKLMRINNSACSLFDLNTPPDKLRRLLRISSHCSERQAGSNFCENCELRATLRKRALPLSAREQDVFTLIGSGKRNREIASHFHISVKTVEAYREHIKTKLGLDSAFALNNAAAAWIDGRFPEKGSS